MKAWESLNSLSGWNSLEEPGILCKGCIVKKVCYCRTWMRPGESLLEYSVQWPPVWGVKTQAQAVDCLSHGLDLTSIWSIYLSIPGYNKGRPYTWKPFSCSCSSWRWRVCMLLMIRLWWPISSTPIRLTSLGREGKHKHTRTHAENTLTVLGLLIEGNYLITCHQLDVL